MSLFKKSVILLIIHVLIVSLLGVKLLYDRATLPRVWVRAIPYDPDLPIRGRYVSLQYIVETSGIDKPERHHYVQLFVKNGRLLAEAVNGTARKTSGLAIRYTEIDGKRVAILDEPVAFFIPEHIPDPSIRAPGKQLWVEATIPKKGIPRPIRLGVKKNGNAIEPLDIR